MIYRLITGVVFILALTIGLAFAVVNAHEVPFNYYLASGEFPLSVLIAATFVAGVMLGVLSMLPLMLRLKFHGKRADREVVDQERELKRLRALPLQD